MASSWAGSRSRIRRYSASASAHAPRSCAAVAHLAGALGKPVWVLLAADADWRWLVDREDSPWYPTARLFRQTQPGDWSGVAERVRRALKDRRESNNQRGVEE